jgi:hypothetical protein
MVDLQFMEEAPRIGFSLGQAHFPGLLPQALLSATAQFGELRRGFQMLFHGGFSFEECSPKAVLYRKLP